eukprot:scaffold16484_cov69-Phaeocystis_antarctica.AAC.1
MNEPTATATDRARGEHGISGSADRWVPSSNGGQSLYCVRRLAATCFGGADPDTQSLLDS